MVQSILAEIAAYVTALLTPSEYVLWVIYALAIVGASFALAWCFSVLRPLAGAIGMAVVALLYGYKRGEKAERQRNTAKQQQQAERGERQSNPWSWS